MGELMVFFAGLPDPRPTCAYTGQPCVLWEPQDPDDPHGLGGCVAVTPQQCPYNDPVDVAALRDWQERQVRTEERDRANGRRCHGEAGAD